MDEVCGLASALPTQPPLTPRGAHPHISRFREVDRRGWTPTVPRPRRLAQVHREGRPASQSPGKRPT
eukprot:6188714-Pleurochrysis_carterae.AAC.1